MSPRFLLIFVLVYGAILFGEWFHFLQGFDFSRWASKDWGVMVGVLVMEAIAVAVIAAALDRALPSFGARAVPSPRSRHQRRSSQR